MTVIKGDFGEKTMDERIKLIRAGLERFAEDDKKYHQGIISSMKEKNLKKRIVNVVSRHNCYVSGLDAAYQLMCKDFNVQYEPIKSRMNVE